MTWGAEHWLWGLALPAFLLALDIYRRRKRSLSKGLPNAHYAHAGFNSIRQSDARALRPIKIFFCLSLCLLAIAMAQPRWGSEKVMTYQHSREVIIAVDLSKSMLAEDIKPNRLERAKLVVSSMLDTLKGESVGMVVFAGTAFLQSPMSPDYQILRGFLKDLSPNFIPQGGTTYGAMLDTALDAFKQSDGMADRFLIVISDGESLDDSWQKKAEELKAQHVKAICLGFGTQEGSFIPDGEGGYVKGPNGAVVLTKLERGTLQELARLTGGVYRESNVWIDLANLVEETVKRGQTERTEREKEETQVERFQYFLGPAVLLMLVSIFREFPSLPKARTIKPEEVHAS